MAFFNKDEFSDFNFDEFLSFRKFISPIVIKILYILGVVAIVLFSLYMMFSGKGFGGFIQNFFIGLLSLIFGNLMWRVSCEMMLLLFSINDGIKKLNK